LLKRVVVGIALGLFGSVISVVQLVYSRKKYRKDERFRRMEGMKMIFLDKDIPRKTREPFFEEFVRLGGNGLYARIWFGEGAG
jgi:hypothetical protein